MNFFKVLIFGFLLNCSVAMQCIGDVSERSMDGGDIGQKGARGEAKLVVLDVKSYEEYEETLALLKMLALGNKQIEEGKFRSVRKVFADLDKGTAPDEL